jgi:uncharacterized membrane protein YphA (DoxX/SURF4 family)
MDQRLTQMYWALRIGLGGAAFLAGLDKFFNILAQWDAYLSPLVTGLVPLSAAAIMQIVGLVEIVAGLVVLAGVTRLGGYVLALWLVGIAVNLVSTGRYFDVAVRDVLLAIAAVTLARLTEVRAEAGSAFARRHAA